MNQITLCQTSELKLVDNQQDYDFVGYIENLDKDGILAIVFSTTEPEYNEELDDFFWDENSWTVEDIAVVKDDKQMKEIQNYVEENESYPNFLQMITIEPGKWGGFLADNEGRSMFNALREKLETKNSVKP